MAQPDQPENVKPRLVRCPACGGDSVYVPSNPYRPFCSERCKNMDLGAWASESFRVPEAPPRDDE
ncbi:DNA gyrase inhibitor YacG [Ramlibacter sp. WS9]|uniref:DNA gyrase inhibitor YacG n=1 Tax=Ramlibacter sp. WS9 TaxID=1882741 RepID=UPI0011438563|nr:DNA gyrase inhibitor YacG [Ramlibacter sp. WS9]ROZ72797.1 DNA gyrase inhibitor YacG [Ramlibacter sp. WS9]